MTVTEEPGDVRGDLSCPSPATVRSRSEDAWSPERPTGGRFWILQESDDDEASDGEEGTQAGQRRRSPASATSVKLPRR
jgi:hypothetical protein